MTSMIYIVSLFILPIVNGLDEWLDDFDFHAAITEKYEVYWNADQEECTLEIGLAVQTDGWVGFGISLSGSGMVNSDIVMGWVTDDGQYILQNRYATGFSTPHIFRDQTHIKPIEGWKEVNGSKTMTYLRFEREMFPDFDPSAVSIKLGTTKVIWAFGELSAEDIPNYHGRCETDNGCRGIESMNLLQGESAFVPLPKDAESHDIFPVNFAVPNQETTYYCSIHELPRFSNKHHVVQIDPLINEENIGIVHHLLMYICPEHLVNKSHVGTGSICNAMNENMPGTECRGGVIFYAWAVGGKSFYLPQDLGLEISGNDYDATQYILLESHYDNYLWEQNPNFIDSSGLRIWHTPTLRPISAAVIGLGLWAAPDAQFIPPGIEKTVNYGYCFADCLENGMDGTDKLYAIANMLHAHLLGRELILRHIRNGQELPPLDMNLAYDFDYQQTVPFADEVEILPGDEFIMECVYDSTERDVMTFGGSATNEEMCQSFLLVYPKPKLAICVTHFDYDGLNKFLEEAEDKGYFDSNINFYNVTVPGALEFYNDFQKGDMFTGSLRKQSCLDRQWNDILRPDQIHKDVLRPNVDYEPFNDEDYYVCGTDTNEQ